MNKQIALLASVATLFAAPAFAQTAATGTMDAPSSYEKTTTEKATDSAGTDTSVKTKVKADVDSKGNMKKSSETTNVTDPKGLFNKTKVVTKDTAKANADGSSTTTHKKTVNGTTVEDTTDKTPANQ